MDFYDLLQRDLPFALSVHYNLLYALSYPDCDAASQALGNINVNLSLLRSAKAQITKEFDQIKMESYIKKAILKESERLNRPKTQQLSKVDAQDMESFMDQRKQLYHKVVDQKYSHVVKTMQSLFTVLQNFKDDEVYEVFQSVKKQLQLTRIDGDDLTHLKKFKKSPLDAAGKSATLSATQMDFGRYVPPLRPIEYQQDQKLEPDNQQSFLELQRAKSGVRLDPFQVGSVKSDLRQTMNIDVDADDGSMFDSPVSKNLSPKEKMNKNLQILRKSQVINFQIQKKEAKYNGLNIEVILDVMNFSMQASKTLMQKLILKQLTQQDIGKIKDNRTQIDLKMQKYYKRLQPKIKELTYKVWGLIDHHTNIQKFTVRSDQKKEDEDLDLEKKEQDVKKNKSQQSKEKEQQAAFRPNITSFKKVDDQQQIFEEAKPEQKNEKQQSHDQLQDNQLKSDNDKIQENKPLIELSELDCIEPVENISQNNNEKNQDQREKQNYKSQQQSQQKGQDQTKEKESQKDQDNSQKNNMQNEHEKLQRSHHGSEKVEIDSNIIEVQEREQQQHIDSQNNKVEDDAIQESNQATKNGKLIQLDAFDTLQQVKNQGSVEQKFKPQQSTNYQNQLQASPLQYANQKIQQLVQAQPEQTPPILEMNDQTVEKDAFDEEFQDQIKPILKNEENEKDAAPQYDAFEDEFQDQIRPIQKNEENEKDAAPQQDAFDQEYPDQIKPIQKNEENEKDAAPQYDAFDQEYQNQYKPPQTKTQDNEKQQNSLRDQIVVNNQSNVADAFQMQDAYEQKQSEVMFEANQNHSDNVEVNHPVDAFNIDELQFNKKNESDKDGNDENDEQEKKSQSQIESKILFNGLKDTMIEQQRILTTEGDDNFSEIADEFPQGLRYPPALEARIIAWKEDISNKVQGYS